jgi:hypothetical protein
MGKVAMLSAGSRFITSHLLLLSVFFENLA